MTPDDLVEIEQIKLLKHRYCRFIDQKRFDDLVDLFIPDATASYGGGVRQLAGSEAIVEWLRSVMAPTTMLTIHQVSQPEIELVGDDRAEATGSWALQDVVVLTEAGLTIRGASYYDDRYVKADGRWRIRHTGYKRVYEEMAPRAGVTLTADWWATEGRSSLA